MKIKESPLEIIDFYVINCTFNAIPFKDLSKKEVVSKNPIEIDFGLQKDEKTKVNVLFMKIWSNQGKSPKTGYSYFIETVTYFRIKDEDKLDEKVKNNLLSYSIIAMVYSNIRTVLVDISSFGPFGQYILPSIDVIDIVNQKIKQTAE